MKIIAKSKRIRIGYFENKRSDYQMVNKEFTEFRDHFPVQDHPVLRNYMNLLKDSEPYFEDMLIKFNKTIRIVTNQANAVWVGDIDLEILDSKKACVNIFIHKRWRKKGYGSSALRLISEIATKHFKITCLTAGISKKNKASLKLFKNIGFKNYGISKIKRSNWAVKGQYYLELQCE